MRSSFRWTERAAIALAVLAMAAPASGLPRRLPPIDQCSADRSFAEFLGELRGIAKRQDSRAFVAMFAPETRKPAGFGGDVDPDDVMPAEDWLSLETVLRMGCARDGTTFVMPSVRKQLRKYARKDLENKVVALSGAELFDPMDESRKVLAVLAWDIATITNNSGDFWTGIRLADGRSGFVVDSDLYFVDPRYGYSEIRFQKRQGRWMITHFWYP